ncbi:hypothetical protein LCGC14_0918920 [marine sediment metagenome]|uniref:Radical SAM core domain-containing protein n=1 Tax=marine sediment metagenome TaxID=412755 RepID=A0A0F9RA41_9ZZZZ
MSSSPVTAAHIDKLELLVSELFGPTFQGEGPSIGTPCMFLRLADCNLACTWCDTKYSWDWRNYDYKKEIRRRKLGDVLNQLNELGTGVKHLVVTGGEPLLQQERLAVLLNKIRGWRWRVEVETAGTVMPIRALHEEVSRFNVSPKLSNSGNPLEKRYKPEVLDYFRSTGKAYFKFVVSLPEDLDEVQKLVDTHHLEPDVYIMPEGTEAEEIVRKTVLLAPHVISRKWNMTTRLHVLAFGNTRGT